MSKKRSRRSRRSQHSSDPRHDKSFLRVAVLLGTTAFFSAFLLFQVQPLICKAILPWFGGAPAVWSTSMFFFQLVLLLGYCYAHWLASFGSTKRQVMIHITLAVLSVALLPIEPAETWKPTGNETNPSWLLIGLLSSTVGLPFFLLSTTAPLVQVWWHRVLGSAPYRLYSISNAGSLLALLSYLFLIEPNLGIQSQIRMWSSLFFFVACLLAWCSYRASRAVPTEETNPQAAADGSTPTRGDVVGWLFLSACGSVLLLAITNHLTQNVAVVPFLWVIPLALYLISFIICFGSATSYRRWLFGSLMLVSQIVCAILYRVEFTTDVMVLLALHLTAMFSGCMVCHGELARMAPAARHLTTYFVMISAGGALGGFLVSIVAPQLFSHYYEYPLVLLACWMVLLGRVLRDKTSWLYGGRPRWAWVLLVACCFLFLWFLRSGVIEVARGSVYARRGFYGVLTIKPHLDEEGGRHMQLVHGIISHGSQLLDEERQFEPTAYYRQTSGLGFAMQHVAGRPHKRVGLLGLGVGTIAAYCEPGDSYRAYEINPHVIEIATDPNAFTFWRLFELRQASGEIILGDARIRLEQELRDGLRHNFDVLVVDVFSGDAIPVHLITRQAFDIYFQHLAEDGLLAVHISNRYLDLMSVVKSLADEFSKTCVFVADGKSEWIIVGNRSEIMSLAQDHPKTARLLGKNSRPTIWTDDYSDILRVLH